MSYAEKTFSDRNRIKRLLQRRRLCDALRLAKGLQTPRRIVDLGAGNGELCKQLAQCYPDAEIVCYEPHPDIMAQARENLAGVANVSYCTNPGQLPQGPVDMVFCLEVFEHLLPAEQVRVLDIMQRLLGRAGRAVIGVPVETGLPALYKGLFRMARRFGEYDARPGHVLRSMIGRPPMDRPAVELMPGAYFYLHHLGFDHERFRRQLAEWFEIARASFSPLPALGGWINAEACYVVAPRKT